MGLLNFISPNFIVSNLQESVSFYVEKLGFEVWHLVPEEAPFFAMIGRENISIMMKEIGPDAAPIPNSGHHPWANWDAYINTSDPDQLYEEFRSRGVTFRQPLKVNDDGILGFEVTDTNGYVLFFGKPNL
ncbi:VOC family protein [Chitinophaga niabensis]|uniref:VOC family protein n=1 Tax=Chitinophaga niabensis TaxID=536979 RepID=UPI0031BB283B